MAKWLVIWSCCVLQMSWEFGTRCLLILTALTSSFTSVWPCWCECFVGACVLQWVFCRCMCTQVSAGCTHVLTLLQFPGTDWCYICLLTLFRLCTVLHMFTDFVPSLYSVTNVYWLCSVFVQTGVTYVYWFCSVFVLTSVTCTYWFCSVFVLTGVTCVYLVLSLSRLVLHVFTLFRLCPDWCYMYLLTLFRIHLDWCYMYLLTLFRLCPDWCYTYLLTLCRFCPDWCYTYLLTLCRLCPDWCYMYLLTLCCLCPCRLMRNEILTGDFPSIMKLVQVSGLLFPQVIVLASNNYCCV